MLYGLFEGAPADAQLRRRLAQEAERDGNEALHTRLARVDAMAAERLQVNDVRRVIRALEVWELTGRPISGWQTQWPETAPACHDKPRVLWLDLPREDLYRRIDARVDQMLAEGLVEEARALRELPRPLSREAMQALGYKELFDYFDGKLGLNAAGERIRTRSRNYAKRQITWFRHLPGCRAATPELTFDLWASTISN